MEMLTDAPFALSLAALALIDGLSIGTLLIPVFLLLAPRLRGGRIVLFLVTIAVFYLGVGMLFTLGLVNVVDVAGGMLSSTPGRIIRLIVGAGLIVVAFTMPTGKTAKKERAAAHAVRDAAGGIPQLDGRAPGTTSDDSDGAPAPQGRLLRWRDRLVAEGTSPAIVMGIAIAAGLIEVATMIPYIAAMSMLAGSEMPMMLRFGALAGYCALMIAPALVLLVLRIVAAPLVQQPLERFAAWLQRTAAENTAWILGIVGFIIARTAAQELGLFQAVGQMLDR